MRAGRITRGVLIRPFHSFILALCVLGSGKCSSSQTQHHTLGGTPMDSWGRSVAPRCKEKSGWRAKSALVLCDGDKSEDRWPLRTKAELQLSLANVSRSFAIVPC
ncbi:hypothetical protein AOLI_G00224460 [Acnodon oligacanthus]